MSGPGREFDAPFQPLQPESAVSCRSNHRLAVAVAPMAEQRCQQTPAAATPKPPAGVAQLLQQLAAAEARGFSALLQQSADGLAQHICAQPEPVPALLRAVQASGCGPAAQRALLHATGLSREDILAYVQARLRCGTSGTSRHSLSAQRSLSLAMPWRPSSSSSIAGARTAAERARSAPTPTTPRLGAEGQLKGAGDFGSTAEPRPKTASVLQAPRRWLQQALPKPPPHSPFSSDTRSSSSSSAGTGSDTHAVAVQTRIYRSPRSPPSQRLQQQIKQPLPNAVRASRALLPLQQQSPPQQQQQQQRRHFRLLSETEQGQAVARLVPEPLAFSWRLPDVQRAAGAVESPVIKLGEQEWRLVAHPQGLNGRGRHLSLYLAAVGGGAQTPFSGWRQRVAFKLSVACQQGDTGQAQLSRSEDHTFDAAEPQYGFTTFAPRAQLLDPAAGFLASDGSLLICAELRPLAS